MSSTPIFTIFIAAIFTNNILLSYFLGMCSFVACSRQIPTALGLGAAVTFVLTLTTALNYLIYACVLIPLGLEHLQFVIFIAVIAAFVQFVEMFVERFSQTLYHALGIFLPLITVNCAILGASLFMVTWWLEPAQEAGLQLLSWGMLARCTLYGLGAGLGWAMAILLIAGLREKMGYSNVPVAFRGVAITMIVTGVMAMAFMGFTGMVSLP